MTSWKKLLASFSALALVIAMGAGCILAPSTFNDEPSDGSTMDDNETPGGGGATTNTDEDEDEYSTGPCPSGTKRYVSTRENVTFCHPESVENQAVTVDDTGGAVMVKVGNEVVRVIASEKVDDRVDRRAKVMEYAATPTDNTITCEAQSVKNEKGREAYVLIGKKNGTQTQEAVSACTDSSKLVSTLKDEPVGMFLFYDNEDDLLIVSGSQDAVLGQMTDDFESTLWPRN